jgi:hypothetical protein
MVLPMTGRETLAEHVCTVGNVKCWPGQVNKQRMQRASELRALDTAFSATAVPRFRKPPSFVFSSFACSATVLLIFDIIAPLAADVAMDDMTASGHHTLTVSRSLTLTERSVVQRI